MIGDWIREFRQMFFPALIFIAIGGVFYACDEEADPEEFGGPPDGYLEFYPEYDWMTGNDIFPNGDDYVHNVFNYCYTDFQVCYDDEFELSYEIPWNDLGSYVYGWARKTSTGEFLYKAYMLAIPDASEKPLSEFGDEILAGTMNPGVGGIAWMVIFVEAIRDNYPDDDDMIEKTVIHELGHVRANLSHLCDTITYPGDTVFSWFMTSDHTAPDCVMGQGKISRCTGEDLSFGPHFCFNCCEKIGWVEW